MTARDPLPEDRAATRVAALLRLAAGYEPTDPLPEGLVARAMSRLTGDGLGARDRRAPRRAAPLLGVLAAAAGLFLALERGYCPAGVPAATPRRDMAAVERTA